MYYKLLNKKNAQSITILMALLTLLLLARDTLYTSCLLGFYRAQFWMFLLILTLCVIFLVNNRKRWREIFLDRRMILLVVSTAVILLPLFAKQDWQLMYLSILLCIYISIFFSYFTDSRTIAKYYVLWMAVIGGISIVATYLLKPLADAGYLPISVFENTAQTKFYNFYLAFAVAQPNYIRNFGIFREPGVYQFFLLLGIYLSNYHVDWNHRATKWTVQGILYATILSTFSTNGILEAVLLGIFVFFDQKHYQNRKSRWLLIGTVLGGAVAVAAAVIYNDTVKWTLYSMVGKLFSLTASSGARMESIIVDFQMFLQHPFIGNGIGEVLYAVDHNTTSTLILLSILGVLGGCFGIAVWVVLLWKKDRNVLMNLLLVGLVFLSFNTQNLVADLFFWIFPIMVVEEKLLAMGTGKTAETEKTK